MIVKINGRYVNTCKLRVAECILSGQLYMSLYEDDEEVITYHSDNWEEIRKQIEQAISAINNLENTTETCIREIILKQ